MQREELCICRDSGLEAPRRVTGSPEKGRKNMDQLAVTVEAIPVILILPFWCAVYVWKLRWKDKMELCYVYVYLPALLEP